MAQNRRRSGCFRAGCFGCSGIAGAAVLFFALVTFMQLTRDSGERPLVRQELRPELPAVSALEDLVRSGELGGTALELSDPHVFETPGLVEHLGTIVLDLNVGEFEIEPGDQKSGIVVDAEFEEDAFRLTEELVENDDGTWTYTVRLRPRGGMIGMMLRGAGNNPQNRITIRLPRDQPLDLRGKLGLGSSEAELGGLLLRSVDLEAGTGEHEIRFSEPLRAPMESFRIDKGIGELVVSGLGNASPARAEISQRIGEATVDLGGPWRRDAVIVVENRIGEATVRAPENARVVVDDASVGLVSSDVRLPEREDLPADAPTIELKMRGRLGEVTLRGR